MNFPNFETHYNICHDTATYNYNIVDRMDHYGVDDVDGVLISKIYRHICKAKKVNTDSWVYGYYVVTPNEYANGELNHAIITYQCEHVCMGEYKDYGWHEVDPNTVCRCTGRLDALGYLIFEHDIVQSPRCGAGEVIWFESNRMSGWVIEEIGMFMDDGSIKRCNNKDITFDPCLHGVCIVDNKFNNTKLTE